MRSFGAAVVAATAVLAFGAAGTARADHAQPKGGGGGGSSSSSAGSAHHSSSSGSGSSSSSHSSGSSSSSSGSSSSAFESTGAQQRHPRAGTGTGWRSHGGRYFYSPYWGGWSGYYGYGYGYGYGWSPYYGYGYAPYGYAPYYGGYYGHRYGYDAAGSVRVMVEPHDTRVYVDGYYAGVADDFDGLFQRLRIAPGRHDIALKLDGYRTQVMKVYVPYDQTVKIHYKMVRGTGEDVSQVVGRPEDVARYEAERDRAARREDEEDDDAGYARDREADQSAERGMVVLDVRPGDASVYVDGTFRGTGRELRRLRLTPGRHRLEVVRPGFRTIERDLDVREGQTTDLDIDLDRS